jgi:hypothetical protein
VPLHRAQTRNNFRWFDKLLYHPHHLVLLPRGACLVRSFLCSYLGWDDLPNVVDRRRGVSCSERVCPHCYGGTSLMSVKPSSSAMPFSILQTHMAIPSLRVSLQWVMWQHDTVSVVRLVRQCLDIYRLLRQEFQEKRQKYFEVRTKGCSSDRK